MSEEIIPLAEEIRRVKPSPVTGYALPADGRGGRVSSERKTAANRIKNLKHGRRAKNPENIRALQISTEARLAGFTVQDRILQLKKHYSLFAASDRKELLNGIETLLGDSLIEILKKKQQGKDVSKDLRDLAGSFMELHDRHYGKININENLNVNKNSSQEEWERRMME